MITAVFKNATRVYERSGTELKMIAEIARQLEPYSVFGFFNLQGEFTVFGHDFATKSVVLVNTTKRLPRSSEGEWPIDKKLDNYYPFVDLDGTVCRRAPRQRQRQTKWNFLRASGDEKTLAQVTGWKFPANNSQGSWQQLEQRARHVCCHRLQAIDGQDFQQRGVFIF